MSRFMIIALAGLAASTIVSRACAQTFHRPQFLVWTTERPDWLEEQGFPERLERISDMTCMIHVGVEDYWNGGTLTPQETAIEVKTKILEAILAGEIDPNNAAANLCITLHKFGEDDASCDPAAYRSSGTNGPLYGTDLTFFREEDRLPTNVLLNDYEFPLDPGIDPVTGGTINRSARTYRHLFLSNAVGEEAPLRQWFKQFCDAYATLQAAPNSGLPDLDGCRFYMDSETSVTWAGNDPNAVFMLRTLAGSSWWNTKSVPGYAPGTTLAKLYQDAELALGFPGPTNGHPAGILDPLVGLEPGVDSTGARNRKFMLWFAEICDTARDAVYQNCFYDVVHDRWPNAKCLNYSDARLDGADGPTGWFMDWNNPTQHDTWNDPSLHDTRSPKQLLPRGEIEAFWTGSLMYGTAAGRYQMIRRWTSGEKDSPVLYLMDPSNHEGWWSGGVGHKQKNLYMPPVATGCGNAPNVPGQPCETLFESTMRVTRHAAESCINSYPALPGDAETSGHEDRLTPWLQLGYSVPCNGTPQPGGTIAHDQARDLLAMLRAKNIREAIYWFGFNPEMSPQEDEAAGLAWFVTGTVIQRVYATEIVDWTALQGNIVIQPSDPPDSSCLEFTLLNSAGNPREIMVQGTGAPGKIQSQLEVRVKVPDAQNAPENYRQMPLIINIESKANALGHKGWVYAMNFFTGQYDMVLQTDGRTAYEYAWSGDGKSSRITCTISNAWQYVNTSTGSPDDGMMKLKLAAKGPASRVDYDLVQVIPYGNLFECSVQGVSGPSTSEIAVPQSDVNFDQLVAVDDLVEFLEIWSEAMPVADANLDGEVDAEDIVEYLLKFEEEQE